MDNGRRCKFDTVNKLTLFSDPVRGVVAADELLAAVVDGRRVRRPRDPRQPRHVHRRLRRHRHGHGGHLGRDHPRHLAHDAHRQQEDALRHVGQHHAQPHGLLRHHAPRPHRQQVRHMHQREEISQEDNVINLSIKELGWGCKDLLILMRLRVRKPYCVTKLHTINCRLLYMYSACLLKSNCYTIYIYYLLTLRLQSNAYNVLYHVSEKLHLNAPYALSYFVTLNHDLSIQVREGRGRVRQHPADVPASLDRVVLPVRVHHHPDHQRHPHLRGRHPPPRPHLLRHADHLRQHVQTGSMNSSQFA